VPRISYFQGIVITMYFNDHGPPHFHAEYGEYAASIVIETLVVREGSLPPRQLRLVTTWAALHRDELHANWERARAEKPLTAIAPLA